MVHLAGFLLQFIDTKSKTIGINSCMPVIKKSQSSFAKSISWPINILLEEIITNTHQIFLILILKVSFMTM